MTPEQIKEARARLDLFERRRRKFDGRLSELDTDRLLELCRQAVEDVERLEAENGSLWETVEVLGNSDTVKALTASLEDIKAGRVIPFDKIDLYEQATTENAALRQERDNLTNECADLREKVERLESKPASGSSEEADHSFRSNAATPVHIACPYCSKATRRDSDHCQHCGALLPDETGPELSAVQPQDWRRSAGGDAQAVATDYCETDDVARRLREEDEGGDANCTHHKCDRSPVEKSKSVTPKACEEKIPQASDEAPGESEAGGFDLTRLQRERNPYISGSLAWKLANRTAERDALQSHHDRLAEENRRLRAELEGTQMAMQAVTEERGKLVADMEESVETLRDFIRWSRPMADLAGSEWASETETPTEVDLSQVCHWLNVTSATAMAIVEKHRRPE